MLPSSESKFLLFLYQTVIGRFFLKLLSSRFISFLCGKFLDSSFSKIFISSFVSKHHISLDDYDCDNFQNFNDFFCRKIKENLRDIDLRENVVISPCDGLLSAYRIHKDTILPIKQSSYTLTSLLQDEELAYRYRDGICLVFRLCVNHYHRYCYLDDGSQENNIFLRGKLHTVRPIALENISVFTENSREYTILHTKHFQDVVQMEVGAMLVGKIKNIHEHYSFVKGEEKGMFLYGGSTIILLFEKNAVSIPKSFFHATEHGIETPVKMGEKIGISKKKKT